MCVYVCVCVCKDICQKYRKHCTMVLVQLPRPGPGDDWALLPAAPSAELSYKWCNFPHRTWFANHGPSPSFTTILGNRQCDIVQLVFHESGPFCFYHIPVHRPVMALQPYCNPLLKPITIV